MNDVTMQRRRGLFALALTALAAGGLLLFGSAPGTELAQAASDEYFAVTYTFTLQPDGSVATDVESAPVSAQYVVNQHRWAAESMPVPVEYNAAGEPPGLGMPALIQQAITSWNAVTPSTFSFAWAGAGAGEVGACGDTIDLDGHNTIRFEPLVFPTLGQTCTVWGRSGGANAKLVEFDMHLDDDLNTWTAAQPAEAGRYDIGSTVLHELGHAAGLGHSSDSSAVMFPSLKKATSKRTLAADDIAGLEAAYPGGATPTPTATPLPANLKPRARTMALARD